MSYWERPEFSLLLAGGYFGLLTILWSMLVFSVGRWGRSWRLAPPLAAPPSADAPLVSICIPARNEARNIEGCVRAALAQRWPSLEVLVVDDRSEDATAAMATAAAGGHPGFRVVPGTPPPDGWAGKPWACSRAAGEAAGAFLLFVDADVRLHPDAVAALVARQQEDGLALISAYGTWELVGFWERAVIPAVGWLIRGAVDLARVNRAGAPEAFANGQMIFVERVAYEDLEGHRSVRDQVLEDVRLAEAFKRRGHSLAMLVAPWLFRVRLYRSLGEIFAGYGKNLYEGMGRRPLIGLGAVLFILVGTLFPYLLVFAALLGRLALGWAVPGWAWVVWAAAICGLQGAFRWRVERHDGRSGMAFWTHPLANLVLVAIILRSVFGVRATWKGRRFVDGRAV